MQMSAVRSLLSQWHLCTMTCFVFCYKNVTISVHNDMFCILSQKRNNIPISAQREGVCSICNTTTFLVIHDHHQLPDGTHFPSFFLYLSIYRGNTCKRNVQTFSLKNLFPFCTEGSRSCYKGYFTALTFICQGRLHSDGFWPLSTDIFLDHSFLCCW